MSDISVPPIPTNETCKECKSPIQIATVKKDGEHKGWTFKQCTNKTCAKSFKGFEKKYNTLVAPQQQPLFTQSSYTWGSQAGTAPAPQPTFNIVSTQQPHASAYPTAPDPATTPIPTFSSVLSNPTHAKVDILIQESRAMQDLLVHQGHQICKLEVAILAMGQKLDKMLMQDSNNSLKTAFFDVTKDMADS